MIDDDILGLRLDDNPMSDLRTEFMFMNRKKNPAIYAVIEVIGCLFGFSGIGSMVAGNAGQGVAMMFAYWVVLPAGILLGVMSCGAGVVVIPLYIAFAANAATQVATSSNQKLWAELTGVPLPVPAPPEPSRLDGVMKWTIGTVVVGTLILGMGALVWLVSLLTPVSS